MIKVKNIGDKGVYSFYTDDITTGFKVLLPRIVELTEYRDGCVLVIENEARDQFCLATRQKIAIQCDIAVKLHVNKPLPNPLLLVNLN